MIPCNTKTPLTTNAENNLLYLDVQYSLSINISSQMITYLVYLKRKYTCDVDIMIYDLII